MDKPLSVRMADFEQSFAQLINNCGLPIYIIEPIIRAYSIEFKGLSKTHTNNERQQYLASLESEATTDETEG